MPAMLRGPAHWECDRNLCIASALILLLFLPASVSVAVAADDSGGAEPPVRSELDFWFDAARIPKSPRLNQTSGASKGAEVAQWPDSSGHERHAQQSVAAARPRLVLVGDRPVVRFDGVDDHLRVVGLERRTDAATVFIVAAPTSNLGLFRGLLAANATGGRDYETGFTIDLGPSPTTAFTQLNVEGQGFGGANNLVKDFFEFGTLHVIEAAIRKSDRVVRLSIDGAPQRTRPYAPKAMTFNELTIGARYYTNGPGIQEVRGPIGADIAEILIYGRELTTDEEARVREYLQKKHAPLREALQAIRAATGSKPLKSIAHPPPVQMFVPGFAVSELPLKLPNINNVRCRPDGKLFSLAYNGDVYLLSDADGDGLEDTAKVFWKNSRHVRSPIGMALTPPGYARGDGVFMATKNECLLVVDTDGDDRADREIVVATGWKETPHSVDALGIAVDPRDGSVYFGRGTANYTEPYLKDKDGRPTYRLDGEQAAILKVAPDFSKREVFATGIRFSVALAFNKDGDLFCTDQEGATWSPNGNPFDELLLVIRGRHYGFPPRHPRNLPNVVDEPSTYDYGPQHQSTCGLTFNEPVASGSAFGPESWRGDALVCGYSRGKLYRTRLSKTPAGYVADNRLIACLNMLLVDCCVTRAGDLVAAVHSGGPDWGSGPGGEGKLYKIHYQNKEFPQPVATWASAPDEVRIAFDRPVDTRRLRGLSEATEITYGQYVRAGDEFESLRPGYEVVGHQMGSPRRNLHVYSAQVTADRRTVILATAPQTTAAWHAIRLPGLGRPSQQELAERKLLPQHPRIDLDYTLSGVEATWETKGDSWSGWLPHLDLTACQTFLKGSADHERLWTLINSAGVLRLRTQLDLRNMLRARVQPGSELDYTQTPEDVTVEFSASMPFTLKGPAGAGAAEKRERRYVAEIQQQTDADSKWLPIELAVESSGGEIGLSVAWHTADDALARPLALNRLLLPWARRTEEESRRDAKERVIPELAGGSWARGRAVFFSEAASCSKCHTVQGEGGAIGPNLSNLVHRDYVSVHRDITQPNFAINPDYIAHVITLKDGRILTGTLHTTGSRLEVSDARAEVTRIAQDDVEEMAPSTKSIMPEGVVEKLSREAVRDLLTFLLMEPPHLSLEGAAAPPPPRSRQELRALLAGAPNPPSPTRRIKVILVAGPKDHGPAEHDYPAWQKAWVELLSAGEPIEVASAWEWPTKADLDSADVIVFYQQGAWTPQRAGDIDAFLKRGGGLVYIHYAVDGGRDAPGFAQRIGLAWQGGHSSFRHGPLDLDFTSARDHPIARNFSKVKFVDESYWNLVGDPARIKLVATGVEDGEKQPLFWTLEPAKGRVFVSIPGHFSWTFDDPAYRLLLLRGIAWVAKEPVDRFNTLAVPGARIAD
jgi:putative heme-binding domain-containing protein